MFALIDPNVYEAMVAVQLWIAAFVMAPAGMVWVTGRVLRRLRGGR